MSLSKKILLIVISLSTIINFILNGMINPVARGGYDFLVFYKAGQEALSEDPQLYKTVMYRKTEYNYIPVVSYAFIPFTLLSEKSAVYIWFSINIILLFYCFYLLTEICKMIFNDKFYIMIFFILFNFNPVHETLKWGQINIFVFCLILLCIYFYFKKKNILSGIFLGLSVVFKIIPVIIIFYFLITKKFKIIFSSIIIILLLLILSISIFGLKTHIDYVTKKLPATSELGYKGNIYDQSFQGLCFRFFWAENDYVTPFYDNYKFAKMSSLFLRTLCFIILIMVLLKSAKYCNSDIVKLLCLSVTVTGIHLMHSLTWEHHLTWSVLLFVSVFAVIKNKKLSKTYFISALFSYLLVSMKYGYDNKILTNGPLIIFTGIKLYGIIIIWIIGILMISKKKLFVKNSL